MTNKKSMVFSGVMLLLTVVLAIVLGIAVYYGAPDNADQADANNGGKLQGFIHKPTSIQFSDFVYSDEEQVYVFNGKDGDMIICRQERNGSFEGTIGFSITCSPEVTWWKGLSLKDSNGHEFKSAEINGMTDKGMKTTFKINTNDLKGKTLVLSKAKVLGAHTDVYAIADTETCFVDGYMYHFVWIKE